MTSKHKAAERLVKHGRQLMGQSGYRPKDGGEIWFKTDDDPLFDDSLEYFAQCGFSVRYLTRDLHNSGFSGSYSTEHERMFSAQGIPIKFLIAVKEPELPQTSEVKTLPYPPGTGEIFTKEGGAVIQ